MQIQPTPLSVIALLVLLESRTGAPQHRSQPQDILQSPRTLTGSCSASIALLYCCYYFCIAIRFFRYHVCKGNCLLAFFSHGIPDHAGSWYVCTLCRYNWWNNDCSPAVLFTWHLIHKRVPPPCQPVGRSQLLWWSACNSRGSPRSACKGNGGMCRESYRVLAATGNASAQSTSLVSYVLSSFGCVHCASAAAGYQSIPACKGDSSYVQAAPRDSGQQKGKLLGIDIDPGCLWVLPAII